MKATLENLRDVRKDITSLYIRMDEKCSYQNLRNLEYQLEDYVKLPALNNLSAAIMLKADQTDYEEVIKDQKG